MWAFSDESEPADRMLFLLLVVAPASVNDSRADVRRLLLPGQRRVHTAKESERRRRAVLDVVGALDAQAVVFSLRRQAGVAR